MKRICLSIALLATLLTWGCERPGPSQATSAPSYKLGDKAPLELSSFPSGVWPRAASLFESFWNGDRAAGRSLTQLYEEKGFVTSAAVIAFALDQELPGQLSPRFMWSEKSFTPEVESIQRQGARRISRAVWNSEFDDAVALGEELLRPGETILQIPVEWATAAFAQAAATHGLNSVNFSRLEAAFRTYTTLVGETATIPISLRGNKDIWAWISLSTALADLSQPKMAAAVLAVGVSLNEDSDRSLKKRVQKRIRQLLET